MGDFFLFLNHIYIETFWYSTYQTNLCAHSKKSLDDLVQGLWQSFACNKHCAILSFNAMS